MTRFRTDWKRGAERPRGKRVGDGAWERFLVYLATMSATQVSKLKGMPSRAAFMTRRKRHLDFAERADAIQHSRKLNNGGRKRITAEQWVSFLSRITGACIHTICKEPGMPSESAVYKRRDSDEAFADQLATTIRIRRRMGLEAALRVRFPNGWTWRTGERANWMAKKRRADFEGPKARRLPLGEALKSSLAQNEIYRAVNKAIPASVRGIARDDIAADMMLAVLDGSCAVADLPSRAKDFIKQHWKLFGTIGTVSLDQPAFAGSQTPLIETISAEAIAC